MNIISGKIENQKLSFNEISLHRFLENHNNKTVTLSVVQTKRTLTQNGYYWLYLNIIATETGNDADELHEFFKAKFLPFKTIKITGKGTTHEFTRLTSTTELSKIDFGDYMDKICSLTSIPLPDPQQAGYLPH